MKRYYMYVLVCADGTLYTGYTSDLERREREHQTGNGAKYTRPAYRRPCRMIYSASYDTKSLAKKAEYRFKQLSRKEKEARLKAEGVQGFGVTPKYKRVDTWKDEEE